MSNEKLILQLNSPSLEERTEAVIQVGERIEGGIIIPDQTTVETNNHIHTMFSFSPYFPIMAAFLGWKAGLQTVGSTDHDSFAAAKEMKLAGQYIPIGTTVGFELRVDLSELGFGNRKINSPDSKGIAYVVAHGIPIMYADKVAQWLKPINVQRNLRNMRMVNDLNSMLDGLGVERLDWTSDVLGASQAANGGAITERHIIYALSHKILAATNPNQLASYLKQDLGISGIQEPQLGYLADEGNPHRIYDLLGVLKSSFLPQFYIQPNKKECIPGSAFLNFVASVQGLSTYSYLGDVTASPTGDKKAEPFEDEYLDELFPALVDAGFVAIAYMIPRNTDKQWERIRGLCADYVKMEINGVDINSSRQSFNCEKLGEERFAYLGESAWALVGHEYEIANGRSGLDLTGKLDIGALNRQIAHYAAIGKASVQK